LGGEFAHLQEKGKSKNVDQKQSLTCRKDNKKKEKGVEIRSDGHHQVTGLAALILGATPWRRAEGGRMGSRTKKSI